MKAVLDFYIIPESIVKFCDTMNTVFNAVFHPIQTIQTISYPLCLFGAGIAILMGLIGFDKYYKIAGAFVLFYLLINLI